MAKEFSELSGYHRAFIAAQHFFFTASAAEKTRVNMSPRSTDLLRVLGPNTVCYLDLTGSGNETAAHIKAGGNLTLMFCAVSGPPLILRLYGRGTVIPLGSNEYDELIAKEYTGVVPLGARQIIRIDFDLVKTSCGFGVPLMHYVGERDTLTRWAEAKGADGLEAYQKENNVVSMDGLSTGLE